MKIKAFSYIRWSSADQGKGDSLRRQVASRDDYCRKNNLTLDEELRDSGVSAYRGKNAATGALRSFLDAVEDGRVPRGSILIVEALDRLSRAEILTALGIFTSLLQAGIAIVTLTDGRKYTAASVTANPMELMFSIMELARSHGESRRKSENIGATWKRKRDEAAKCLVTRRVSAWIMVTDGDKLLLDPRKAPIVRRIVRMATDGDGAVTIAIRLNRDRVKPFVEGRKSWAPSSIKKILRNPALIGVYQPYRRTDAGRKPDGKPVLGYFPAAITETEWYALQAAIVRRRTTVRGRAGVRTTPNLFGRILRCGTDGSTFNLSRKSPKRTLASCCTGIGNGHRHTFCYEDLEANFLEAVGQLDPLLEKSPRPNRVKSLLPQLASAEARREFLENKVAGAKLRDIEAELGSLRKVVDEIRRLKEEIESEKRIASDEKAEDAIRFLRNGATRLRDLQGDELAAERARCRNAIARLCEKVEVFVRDEKGIRVCLVCATFREGGEKLFGWTERRHAPTTLHAFQRWKRSDIVERLPKREWFLHFAAPLDPVLVRKPLSKRSSPLRLDSAQSFVVNPKRDSATTTDQNAAEKSPRRSVSLAGR